MFRLKKKHQSPSTASTMGERMSGIFFYGAGGLLGILALLSKPIFASSCCLLLLLLVSGGRGIYQLPLSTMYSWRTLVAYFKLQRDLQLMTLQ